ncbi:relaxase/mobilization nuclease domain-containing protein [Staphylococcus gallinarum]|uniref:relaxase/mobilization nuclease domain-containing protein n=1 Tax=Staphylococcus gallinarum TaxID=1293 RepID=UPI0030C50C18
MSKNLTFIKVTNTKSIEKVKAHSKYIGFRSRENHQNARGLFDKTRDSGVSHSELSKRLSEKPSLRHSQSNKAFKVVLSWREKDAREMGIHDEQKYKEIARTYVEQLEKDKGMKLDYIGAVHMKDEHPHIHLVISGVGEDKETGQDKRLRIDFREDIPNQKDFMDKEIGADRLKEDREVDERLRGSQGQERGNIQSRYNTIGKDVTKDVFKAMEQMGKQAQRQSEQARQQQERETMKNSKREDMDRGIERERER